MVSPVFPNNPFPKAPCLGPRLEALFKLISECQTGVDPYHTLWDCCCDHGYLGVKVLYEGLCQHLHFNDQVPHLIDQIKGRLSQYPKDSLTPSYSAETGDAGQLRLSAEHKHLVILAGIGGEHTVTILKGLIAVHEGQAVDFLFCPATTQFDLRAHLGVQHFHLLDEFLVSERGRDYEVIHARLTASRGYQPVSSTGRFWQADNQNHLRYLRRTIEHYQRRTRGEYRQEAQRVLSVYLKLWLELTGSAYNL